MTSRSVLSVSLLFALGTVVSSTVFSAGCSAAGVGDPCIPEQEYDPTFNGFDEKEVNVESKSFQCRTRLCLVNHFRGRASCPYGQDDMGNAQNGATKGCFIPGSDESNDANKIVGNAADKKTGARVQPQCIDRGANNTVYCSCRCANVDGKTDDGAVYCKCPDGFACVQLVSSIGQGNEGLTGAYCIKSGTDFQATGNCGSTCDKAKKETTCGNDNP